MTTLDIIIQMILGYISAVTLALIVTGIITVLMFRKDRDE